MSTESTAAKTVTQTGRQGQTLNFWDVDTALHPDATLEFMGHPHARSIVAPSLKRNTTRRNAAQAVTNSQRPEVHGTSEAFLVEAGPRPETSKRRTVQPELPTSSKGDGGERKNCTKGYTELGEGVC